MADRKNYKIPLSYNPIDPDALARKLHEYDGRHHDEIITDFEAALRDYTGSKYVVALNSGTSAIHLGLKALGVGENDYVIASTFTYVASVNPVLYLKAIPVFVDSEMQTWNMDPDLLEQAIDWCLKQGKKPKAIILVHTYGMPAQLDRILAIARHHEIPVLEDAAEAIGSTYRKKALGTHGEVGVLSFNNNKLLTTYGGGALLTGEKAIYDRVLHWATQSRENLPYYEHTEVGFNYRMSPVNACAGLVQLSEMQMKMSRRREIFDFYQSSLGSLPDVSWQSEGAESFSNRWISALQVGGQAENFRQILENEGIETRPLWRPMHFQTLFGMCPRFLCGISDRLFDEGICLPSGSTILDLELKQIVAAIQSEH